MDGSREVRVGLQVAVVQIDALLGGHLRDVGSHVLRVRDPVLLGGDAFGGADGRNS